MKPRIGIGVDARRDPDDARSLGKIQLNWNYAQLVADAGGVPLLVPPMADMEELAGFLDGWLVPGGDDLDPTLWGEPLHPRAELQDPIRFSGERALYEASAPEMPVLGICYGAQMLNVVRGGTLSQHVPELVGHEDHSGGTLQTYRVDPESRLAAATGVTEIVGKSYHHQAVAKLGAGLRIVARHADGTVEAIEDDGPRWLIGVQWHPERTPEDSATRNLFRAFVEAANSYGKRRQTAGVLR